MKTYILGVFNAAVFAVAMLCSDAVAQDDSQNAHVHSGMPIGVWIALFVALLSLLGTIFVPIFNQRRQSKRERYRELQSKLSEVMAEIGAIEHWAFRLQTYYDGLQFPNLSDRKEFLMKATELRNPGEKIWAITFGYFPESTHDSAEKLKSALIGYHVAAINLGMAHHVPPQGSRNQQQVKKLHQMKGSLNEAKREFEKVMRTLMDDYLNEKSPSERKTC